MDHRLSGSLGPVVLRLLPLAIHGFPHHGPVWISTFGLAHAHDIFGPRRSLHVDASHPSNKKKHFVHADSGNDSGTLPRLCYLSGSLRLSNAHSYSNGMRNNDVHYRLEITQTLRTLRVYTGNLVCLLPPLVLGENHVFYVICTCLLLNIILF
ncbi:hypothetical protein BDZ94DRAFT_1248608 [Collybia nuda]|uniref:Uncharacterized protein n=1 Tax=Collybia nuda TaxID=64659 RepID=A0A9P5YEY0_9AGAR|nr:hypothetical protein BDZ94DRAFT_1248608 [Collybia nuda]